MSEGTTNSLESLHNFIKIDLVPHKKTIKGEFVERLVENYIVHVSDSTEKDVGECDNRGKAWWLDVLSVPTVLIN
jgi:hypothetical protein